MDANGEIIWACVIIAGVHHEVRASLLEPRASFFAGFVVDFPTRSADGGFAFEAEVASIEAVELTRRTIGFAVEQEVLKIFHRKFMHFIIKC